jgi:hypothetical protein
VGLKRYGAVVFIQIPGDSGIKYGYLRAKTINVKKLLFLVAISTLVLQGFSQNKTDASLFMRSDSTKYLEEVASETGDLYSKIGHHGPAVENQWFALRIYFDHKCAIDVYNKARPGLELMKERWYPDADKQKNGWGADYYKVGSTVGLGGIRLWDGNKVLELDPVTKRTARVMKGETTSTMEMLSEGVPYMGRRVNILVRVTVDSDTRYATVEAKAVKGGPVKFVTGINYHPGEQVEKRDGLIATWGEHPEDVAAEKVSIGSAILYDPEDFDKVIDDGTQYLLVSKPAESLETKITSANAREPEINTMDRFMEFLEK